MLRPTRTLTAFVAAATLLTGCAAFETAAAVVDGTKIEADRFQRLVEFFASGPEFSQQFAEGQGEQEKKDLARQLLSFLIHQVVIDEEAEVRDIDVRGDAVEQRMQQLVQDRGGEQRFEEQLDASGASRADVEEFIRQDLLREEVARAVVSEGIPDAELREEYTRRLVEFTEVHVAHILVQDPELAQRLAGQATPQNFDELARKFSEDPSSAEQGGDLGVRQATDFAEPFGSTTVQIPVGQIGGPIETEFGHHIILVKERTEMPFETVRDQLLAESGEEFFIDWLLERVREADVLVNPRFGVFDEQSGEVIDRRATTPLPPSPGDVQVEP